MTDTTERLTPEGMRDAVVRFLEDVERGAIALVATEEPQGVWAGEVTYHASNGWAIVVFSDCNDFDYIDSVRSPSFALDFNQLQNLGIGYRGPEDNELTWDCYGIGGYMKHRGGKPRWCTWPEASEGEESEALRLKVVAELGSNVFDSWGFSPERCLRLLDAASVAGATHAKAQLYRHAHFPASEWSTKRATEFPRDRLDWFVVQCLSRGLSPGFSVFDLEDVDDALAAGAGFLKLATREEDNLMLFVRCLRAVEDAGVQLFRSVDWNQLVFGPRSLALPDVITLACVPIYPTISTPTNLHLLPARLPVPFGWSSHTPYWNDCVEAVDYGAVAVEKHICLDPSDPEGPWSLGPEQFFQMVTDLWIAYERSD